VSPMEKSDPQIFYSSGGVVPTADPRGSCPSDDLRPIAVDTQNLSINEYFLYKTDSVCQFLNAGNNKSD